MIARFLRWLFARPAPPVVGTDATHPLPDVGARPIPPVPGDWGGA